MIRNRFPAPGRGLGLYLAMEWIIRLRYRLLPSRIPIHEANAKGTLTIGARQGDLEGMADQNTFHPRWFNGQRTDAANFTERPDLKVPYQGEAVTVTH